MNNKVLLNPKILIKSQFIKDLSFERPIILTIEELEQKNEDVKPKINIDLDVSITKASGSNDFEISLNIKAEATVTSKTLFVIELVYIGIFHLMNIPEEQKKAMLSVYCPSLIFPYARNIISYTTQNGGFQPLMIDPVDFTTLFQQKVDKELSI